MSGKVSHDGKSVVNDSDNKSYSVNNPNALQNYEDEHVAMIVHFDPDNNAIHIISVAPPQPLSLTVVPRSHAGAGLESKLSRHSRSLAFSVGLIDTPASEGVICTSVLLLQR